MSEIEIKIVDLKNTSEVPETISKNILRYMHYLNENYLPKIFSEFDVKDYDDGKFFVKEDQMYYEMYVEFNDAINTSSFHEILNGPIKKLYDLDGVVDIKLHYSAVSIIYFAPFFLQENLFASFEAVDKFNL